MANTGRRIVTTIKRVRNDIVDPEDPNYRAPVDANGVPTSISGNPQEVKSNTPEDPDYIAPYSSPLCSEHFIGEQYQGGTIIALSPDKRSGFIVTNTDVSSGMDWSVNLVDSIPGTSTEEGDGSYNTEVIVASQGAGTYAAKACDDLVEGGYSDWFLPSRDELIHMQTNKAVLTGLIPDEGEPGWSTYWTSSQAPLASNAYYMDMFAGAGTDNFTTKGNDLGVRAYRIFDDGPPPT